MPYPTDYAITIAQIAAHQALEDKVYYKGFTIQTWKIEGYGWVGEVRDAGNNLYPDWMHTQQGYKMRCQAVDFMIARVDEYLSGG